ncbi:hypothetical protein V1279_006964 [Bradyrhizobium sp. AZCC 1610]
MDGASAPPGLEAMTDDNQRRTRTLGSLAAFRFARSGVSQPVVLRRRLERTQEIPPLGSDSPTIAIAKHMAAGENMHCQTRPTIPPRGITASQDALTSYTFTRLSKPP